MISRVSQSNGYDDVIVERVGDVVQISQRFAIQLLLTAEESTKLAEAFKLANNDFWCSSEQRLRYGITTSCHGEMKLIVRSQHIGNPGDWYIEIDGGLKFSESIRGSFRFWDMAYALR